MKRIMLLLLAAVMSVNAMADNKVTRTTTPDITSLKVGKTTDKEVEAMLGRPTNTQTGDYNKFAKWEYVTIDMRLNIVWNTKNVTIERYSYSSGQQMRQKQDAEWNNSNTQLMVPGESKLDDVLKLIGTPADLEVDKNSQVAKYNFKAHAVMLRFNKGTLVDMNISYLTWKKEQ